MMPRCCACDVEKFNNSFSGNQLRSRGSSPRCKNCIQIGYSAGHAVRIRQLHEAAAVTAAVQEQAAAAEAAAAAAAAAAEQESRERAERERAEQEQRERAEREQRERAARDVTRENRLRLQCAELHTMRERLQAIERRVAADVAAMPPAQRQRVRSDPRLHPLQTWPCETALRWFDDTFCFSDLCKFENAAAHSSVRSNVRGLGPLCIAETAWFAARSSDRDAFKRSHVGGAMLRFANDRVLETELGMRSAWHRSEVLRTVQEMLQERAAAEHANGGAAAASDGGGTKRKRDEECVICTDAAAEVAVVPCGHRCLCVTCARTLLASPPAQKRCPMCRVGLQSTLRVYVMDGD